MTRSATNPLVRLMMALALTLAALFGSVAFASAASADDDKDRGSSYSQSDDDEDDDDKDDDDKDDDDKDDDDKDDDDKDDQPDVVKPPVVEYADGDVIDKIGSVVAKKAPQLTPKFEAVAPQLRTLLANHLTKQGATVVYDARGRLVIAPYLCDPKKLKLLQPGCVTSLPTSGGGRF